MRKQRALAAACATVAVLGFAAPAALADGMGNGSGSSDVGAAWDRGNDVGRGDDFDRRGDDFRGRGDDFDRRRDDFGGRGDDFGGRGDDSGGGGDDGRGRGDGGPRNIVATPGALAPGGRLSVAVNDCRGGTMSSRAFRTTQLVSSRDDTSSGSIVIDRDARPGRYDVTVRCDGRTLTRPAAFSVLGGVRGGAGGARSSGATPTDMAIGGGLVASAVIGGGAFWARRRNENRP